MPNEPIDPNKQKSDLLDSLLDKDPEIRDQTLKALSKLHPDRVLPEVRADEKISAAVERAKKMAVEEIEAKQKQKDFEDSIAQDKKEARSKYKLDDAGMKKVEEVMAEKRIGSYQSAAEFLSLQTKPAAPTPSSLTDRDFKMPDRKEYAEMWNNPVRYRKNKLHQLLGELESQRNE